MLLRSSLWDKFAMLNDAEPSREELLQRLAAAEAEIARLRANNSSPQAASPICFATLFEQHGAVCLLINPDTGAIIDANPAACRFYGWTREELRSRHLCDISTAPPVVITDEVEKARSAQRTYSEFQHCIADGSIRDVAVFSSNVIFEGRALLLSIIHDDTEFKQAQRELEERNELRRALVEASPVGIYAIDLEGRVIEWNASAERLFGWTAEEVIGKPLPHIPHDQKAAFWAGIQQVIHHKGFRGKEMIRLHKDGRLIPIRLSTSLLHDAQGKGIGIIGVAEDISAEKDTRAQLSTANARFDAVIESARAYVWEIDLQGRLLYISPSVQSLLGYHPNDLIQNRTLWDLSPESERDAIRTITLNLIHENGLISNFENIVQRADGTLLWVASFGRIIHNDHGEVIGYRGFDIDISERIAARQVLEERERQIRTLVESMEDLVFVLDENLVFQSSPQGHAEHLLFTPAEFLGKPLPSLPVPEPAHSIILDSLQQILATGQPVCAEYPLELQGQTRWFDLRASIQQPDTGRPRVITCVVRDITESKAIHHRLQDRETQFRALFDDAPLAMYLHDAASGEILEVNKAALQSYGATNIDELRQCMFELPPPYSQAEALSFIRKAASHKNRMPPYEWCSKRSQGVRLWEEIHLMPLDINGRQCVLATVVDITERKQAEQALRESEQRLALALDAAHQGMYDLNIVAGEAIVGPQYALMLGYDPATFRETHERWLERLHPDDLDLCKAAHSNYISGRIPAYRVQFRQRTADGQWRWILSVGRIVERDAHGKPLRMLGTHTDIHSIKLTEEQLREKDILLTEAEQIAQLGCWVLDHQKQTLAWTEEVYRIFGVSPSDFQPSLESSLACVPPEDREEVLQAFTKSLNDGSVTYEKDHRIIHPATQETRHVMERCVHQRDANGKPTRSIGIVLDITDIKRAEHALRQSEERLSRLNAHLEERVTARTQELRQIRNHLELSLEAGQIGRWLWDIKTGHVDWDAQMYRLYDCDELSFKPSFQGWASLVSLSSMDAMNQAMKTCLATGQRFSVDLDVPLKNGQTRTLKNDGILIHDENHEPWQMVGINYDISAMAERERSLMALNQQLAEATRQKNEFLANISHELRTPLNAVLGMSQSLQMGIYGAINDAAMTPIQRIEESGRHLLTIINDLLDLAKIEAGQMQLDLMPVAIDAVIISTINLMLDFARANNLRIEFTPEGPDVTLSIDFNRVRQILINLLSNAIKFTPTGGRVTVTRRRNPQAQTIEISVADTGEGIAQEKIPLLFRPFTQLEPTTRKRHSGTGLGLSIVRRLTELHGGTVSVTSTVGHGSTFTFSLPLDRLAPQSVHQG